MIWAFQCIGPWSKLSAGTQALSNKIVQVLLSQDFESKGRDTQSNLKCCPTRVQNPKFLKLTINDIYNRAAFQ